MVRSLGLAARTHFLGWRADLARVYADLDVVALTSRNEGSPIALIEAMAAARPVVSTRAGGVADVVADGETGLLAEVDDHDGLAAAVVRVLQDQELARRLGASGRRHSLRSYGSGRLLADIDSLYTRLLAGPSAASAGASRPR
jgi:glycosyltransferase involved in cell wall biosynthesis